MSELIMGTTYHYTNLTKREWFSVSALGGNPKLSGLGRNLTARAFDLLLVGNKNSQPVSDPVQLGRWAGDTIVIIGDSDDNWLQYNKEFADIEADVILLLLINACDGFKSIAAAAENDDGLFMQLCHLVVTRQALQLEPHMKEHFGKDFRERYKRLCNQRQWFHPKDVSKPAKS
jgi:hypothetical protein